MTRVMRGYSRLNGFSILLITAAAVLCALGAAQSPPPPPEVPPAEFKIQGDLSNKTERSRRGSGDASLSEFVHDRLARGAFQGATWGVSVVRASTGESLCAVNEDLALMPASNRKLVTAGMVFDSIGPDGTLKTKLYSDGAPNASGALRGDLVIVGVGDPAFSSRLLGGRADSAPLRDLARQLKESGITALRGDVIIDSTRFPESERFGEGWQWDYLGENYAPSVSALTFNENMIAVTISPGSSVGARCRVTWTPNFAPLAVANETRTGSARTGNSVRVRWLFGGRGFEVTGRKPLGEQLEVQSVAAPDPNELAGLAFLKSLADEGIETGEAKVRVAYDKDDLPDSSGLVERGVWESPPMSDLVRKMLKTSDNFIAEQLYRAVAALRGSGGIGAARQMEEQFFRQLKVDTRSWVAADGSGLSRLDLVTADGMTGFLRALQGKFYFDELLKALPHSGMDGTLSGRLGNKGERGRVVAKTGTIAQVSSLSGYVLDSRGRPKYVFSILCNNFSCSAATVIETQDAICRELLNR